MLQQCLHTAGPQGFTPPVRGGTPALLKRNVRKCHARQQPEAPGSAQPSTKKAPRGQKLCMQATKSKGFGGGALTDKLQLEDITSRETLREGDNVQVEVSMGPEETLKAWNSVAAKNQRRTPSDADIRKGISDRAQEAGIKEKAIQKLMLASLPIATKPYASKVLEQSLRIVETAKAMSSRFQPYKPFTFVIAMKLTPEIRWLKPYNSLQVDVPYLVDNEVNQKNADAKLKELQRRTAKLRVVQGRGCQPGDVAMIKLEQLTSDIDTNKDSPPSPDDFQAQEAVKAAREKPGILSQVVRVDTGLPEQWTAGGKGHAYAPEIVEGIMGMQTGQTRVLKLYKEAQTGKWWLVRIEVNELFSWDLPEMIFPWKGNALMTDVWANGLTGGWKADDMEQLKKKLLQMTEAEAGNDAAQATFLAIAQAVAAAVEIEVPESLIEEVGRMEFQKEATQYVLQEKIDKARLEKMVTESAVNQFIDMQRDNLTELCKKEMGIQEIYEREDIEVTEQEVLAEMTATAEQFEGMEETFDPEKLREQVIETIKGIKTLSWLEKHAQLNYVAPPAPIVPSLLDGYVGQEELVEISMPDNYYTPQQLAKKP